MPTQVAPWHRGRIRRRVTRFLAAARNDTSTARCRSCRVQESDQTCPKRRATPVLPLQEMCGAASATRTMEFRQLAGTSPVVLDTRILATKSLLLQSAAVRPCAVP
jgi:hypothetical protein